jgi:hypothetical protein
MKYSYAQIERKRLQDSNVGQRVYAVSREYYGESHYGPLLKLYVVGHLPDHSEVNVLGYGVVSTTEEQIIKHTCQLCDLYHSNLAELELIHHDGLELLCCEECITGEDEYKKAS